MPRATAPRHRESAAVNQGPPPPPTALPSPPAGSPRYFALLYTRATCARCSPCCWRWQMRSAPAARVDLITRWRTCGSTGGAVRLERYARGEPQHPWLRALLAQHPTCGGLDLGSLVRAAALDLAAEAQSARARLGLPGAGSGANCRVRCSSWPQTCCDRRSATRCTVTAAASVRWAIWANRCSRWSASPPPVRRQRPRAGALCGRCSMAIAAAGSAQIDHGTAGATGAAAGVDRSGRRTGAATCAPGPDRARGSLFDGFADNMHGLERRAPRHARPHAHRLT